MDSMRHLSTSLPQASSRQRNDNTSDILSDFRAAALSVTNLYKSAAKSQERSRAAGYQDALDDLLTFLDKENLGLGDGEGWRVRQWATERLDGTMPKQGTDSASNMADDEDEGSAIKEDDKEDERGSSPEVQRKPHLPISSSELTETDTSLHRRVVSEPPQTLPQTDFTFQSSHAYPTNHDREAGGMEVDTSGTPPQQQQQQQQHSLNTSSTPSSTETVRVIPKTRNRHNRRNENRLPTINFNLGSGAGSKRKMPYPDFFDISGFNSDGDRKDGNANGRGGKRGRHV